MCCPDATGVSVKTEAVARWAVLNHISAYRPPAALVRGDGRGGWFVREHPG